MPRRFRFPLTRSAPLAASLALFAAAALAPAHAQELAPFNASGIYALGEKAGWTVRVPTGSTAAAGSYSYSLRQNNATVLQSGSFTLADGPATIETTLAEPAMLLLTVTSTAGTRLAGAAIAPTALQPSAPRPPDFDAFWESKIAALHKIVANPVLTPAPSNRAGVDYATLTLNNIGGALAQGQIARPSGDGKFPALLILQWAGAPYPLQKSWVTDRAAEGWLALNLQPHDVPVDAPASYYAALPAEIKNYHTIGNDDRDRSYFLQMYLGAYRAADYLASHPNWDGRTLVVTGISMGGQQSSAVAGLHPLVTHLVVHVPAGADSNGNLHGRKAGYPYWDSSRAKVMETALYFDTVNFAPRITATSLVSMGFLDDIAPPVGIWTACNQIPALKEVIPLVDAPHNHLATAEQQRPYTLRSAEWLNALRSGTFPKINPAPSTPVLAWSPPPALQLGTALSSAQLAASTLVRGTFAYTPAAGTELVSGTHTVSALFTPDDTVNYTTATAQATVTVHPAGPAFTTQPTHAAAAPGANVSLSVVAAGDATLLQWQRNGTPRPGATAATLALDDLQPAATGLYTAVAADGASTTTSHAAIVGLTTSDKVTGAGDNPVDLRDIKHPGGNTFDQVLLTGTAAAITADHLEKQITRLSFVDLDDDIVQVEFSGPGTLSLVLDHPSGPAAPASYNQAVNYMKGHAGIVITGATEQTNVSVFSVGKANAVNQALFKDRVAYDGIADVAFIAISSSDGKFGGVRTANAHYFATRGLTGLYAPGVAFQGPVFIGDLTAFDTARPVIVLGSAADTRITGGDLEQDNAQPVEISGIAGLQFTAGSDSHGNALPAQTNRAAFR